MVLEPDTINNMGIIGIIGIIGNVLLGLCAFPQAYKCFVTGNGIGLSKISIWCWMMGEVFTFSYVILEASIGFWTPLTINYVANFFALFVIMKYIYYPRGNT